VYEYDEAGRMVASRPEPEWDDQERGWMLALADLEAGECHGCGGDLEETTDPENDGRYAVGTPIRCHKCTALAIAKENHAKQGEVRHPEALMWPASLRG
jgi:hypothetical protein